MSPAAPSDEKKSPGKNPAPPYVALTGNPNSGKTTLFNALTGLRAKVGNYAGVTVERKEGRLLSAPAEIKVLDLPGTYSLSPQSLDEQISRDVLLHRLAELPRAFARRGGCGRLESSAQSLLRDPGRRAGLSHDHRVEHGGRGGKQRPRNRRGNPGRITGRARAASRGQQRPRRAGIAEANHHDAGRQDPGATPTGPPRAVLCAPGCFCEGGCSHHRGRCLRRISANVAGRRRPRRC